MTHVRLDPLPPPVSGDGTYRILSYGGGTQSAALALMSAAGDLPRVDAVIMADTQGELPETYAYAQYVTGRLRDAGIPMIVVTAGSLESALLADTPTSSNPTPPAHVLNPDGSKGRIGAYRCSWDYKRRLITQTTKELVGPRGAWKRANVEQWIGMSVDELSRCKPDPECRCGHTATRPPRADGSARGHVPTGGPCTDCPCERFDPWRINTWPLVDLRFRRGDTIRWFGDHGHPTPPVRRAGSARTRATLGGGNYATLTPICGRGRARWMSGSVTAAGSTLEETSRSREPCSYMARGSRYGLPISVARSRSPSTRARVISWPDSRSAARVRRGCVSREGRGLAAPLSPRGVSLHPHRTL